MDNMIYILTICIVAPLILMLFLLESKSRITVAFMIVGIFVAVFVSGINSAFLHLFHDDYYYVTTTITPVCEEICKALPVLYCAFLLTDDRDTIISISIAIGIGFAIMENSFILLSNVDTVNLFWALMRGFGAGLMHGICTATVGIGMTYVHKRKKLFYTGTFALLSVAIIYHSIYNMLVQSKYSYIGFIMPMLTYIPIIVVFLKTNKNSQKSAKINKQ